MRLTGFDDVAVLRYEALQFSVTDVMWAVIDWGKVSVTLLLSQTQTCSDVAQLA